MNNSSSTQQFLSIVLILLVKLQYTLHVKVKISFNIIPFWETPQISSSFCKFPPIIRFLASILVFPSWVVISSTVVCLSVLLLAVSISRSCFNFNGISMVYPLLLLVLYPHITPSFPLITSIIFPRFHFDFGLLSSVINTMFSVSDNACPESSDFWCLSCNFLKY